jgi:Tol biopolymer transport system component
MIRLIPRSKLILIFLITTLLVLPPIQAQFEPPLNGPIIATTPAQQDRILLHDLGSEGYVRALEFGSGEIHVWDFSPNGCRILFTQDTDGIGLPKIYSAALDGSDVQALVSGTVRNEDNTADLPESQWGIWEPDWSSQDIIAFTLYRRERNTRTGEMEQTSHIAHVPGRGGIPELYSVTGNEFTPVWSPDGQWLSYVSYDERPVGADPQSTAEPTQVPQVGQAVPDLPTISEADLWIVSSDGETKYRLTGFETGSVRHPRWSPDGELIGFVYAPSPSNDTLWMIANSPAALPTQLNYQWQLTLDHTWLPDSSAMLASLRNFRDVTENRLWRIPLVGNADTNDADLFLQDDTFLYTDYPRFSPDGRYLAFRSDYNLIVVDLQDNAWQRLDTETPGTTPPVWSPAEFAGEESCAA